MTCLITSCGRPDLLQKTIESLLIGQRSPLRILVHEDSPDPQIKTQYYGLNTADIMYFMTNGIGQHKSIEHFLKSEHSKHLKYYLHCEDDFEFKNSYDWIDASVRIMQEDPMIIKVLAREGSPHPCVHKEYIRTGPDQFIQYGYLEPWTGNDGIKWSGFSFNPGITRADLLRQFISFPRWEQELAEKIHVAGFKVVEIIPPVYSHIGDGRTTVEIDPGKR